MAFKELRMHFSTKKWPLSGGALRAQSISNLAARYARKGCGGRAARVARTLTSAIMKGRGGAAVSDVFRYEEVPPSHQPSGGGHEAGSPLGRRPWSARRGHGLPRASATWLAPGCRPHRGAAPQLRFVVGRYAATAARYAARRLVPRSGTTSWPRRGLGAAAHRYGVPVQSLFMKPSKK